MVVVEAEAAIEEDNLEFVYNTCPGVGFSTLTPAPSLRVTDPIPRQRYHATKVCDIIKGASIGIAPFVRLTNLAMPFYVDETCGRDPVMRLDDFVRAMDLINKPGQHPNLDVVVDNVDIVNLSVGSYLRYSSDTLVERIQQLEELGVAVILAVGNAPDMRESSGWNAETMRDGPTVPARFGCGLTVGSCRRRETGGRDFIWEVAGGSQWGPCEEYRGRRIVSNVPHLVAPGVGLHLWPRKPEYYELSQPIQSSVALGSHPPAESNTSFATAVVTAVAARLLVDSRLPRSPQRVRTLYRALIEGCEQIVHDGVPVAGQGAGVVHCTKSHQAAVRLGLVNI